MVHRARRLFPCVAKMALMSSTALVLFGSPAAAQQSEPRVQSQADGTGSVNGVQEGAQDEIVVTGVRETQRNSIETKRNSTLIVDALVSEAIGETPDQSVGETLERIVGVTADRFKGSASEISIRGLGPFLGFSTLNGREVTNGSGDRAVSFQQFPSELVNGVLVFKSQNASLVEGGTSGVIDLRTLRPLDAGRRRIRVDVRGVYEELDDKIDGRDGLGYRVSASYVDQFDLGDGELGVSFGYARADESAPEDFYTESSTVQPCNSVRASANCTYSATSGNPVYFVPNNYLFRQSNNNQNRDAFIGTLQYKPRPELNINIDGQYSTRFFEENRSDLVIAEGLRGIDPLDITDNGALLNHTANSRIESQTRIRRRDEDYYGGGVSVEWTDDAAKVGFDVSYSRTERTEVDRSTRLRTSASLGFPVGGSGSTPSGFSSGRVPYQLDKTGGFPLITFDPRFDVTNHDYFNDAAYARRDQYAREDKIFAVRLDGEAFVADSFITSVQGGLRYSDHNRVADLDNQNRLETIADPIEQQGNQNCRIDFRQQDYFASTGGNLSNWAQFDPLCMYATFAGTEDAGPAADPRSTSDIDVTERIMAGYVMANFASADDRLTGNIGVRVVNTTVDSVGFRGAFNATLVNGSFILTPTGDFDVVKLGNEFTNVLPSLNLTYRVTPEFQVRGAVYRAISRPNIEAMGAGRDILTDEGTNPTIADAIAGASGGNPRLEPLQSWNGDLSLEWYPNDNDLLSVALFYKQLKAGIVPADANALSETFVINGQAVTVPVAQQTNDESTSDLWGAEVSVSHAMTYLPGALSGLGFIGAYSYADTNFEYADPSAVNPAAPIRNFTTPAEIIGLSRHTLSATGYFDKGPVELRIIYKYRSRYLKPFELNANRFAKDGQSLDASASFDITKNLQLRFQAINLTNEPQVLERPVPGAISEVSVYGRRFYGGAVLRF